MTARMSDDFLRPFTPAPQVKFRTTPQARAAVTKAFSRCPDCFDGKRKDTTKKIIHCEACNGTGHLEWMSPCLIASAAGLHVAKTYDALLDLRDQSAVECHLVDGVEQWRLTRQQQSSRSQVSR